MTSCFLLLSANTLMELDRTLTEATKTLVNTEKYMIASVTSGCEIFVKFITRTAKLELKVIPSTYNSIISIYW